MADGGLKLFVDAVLQDIWFSSGQQGGKNDPDWSDSGRVRLPIYKHNALIVLVIAML